MSVIGDLFGTGAKGAIEGLSNGVAKVVSTFKADPTKIAELEQDLQKVVLAHQEKVEELGNDLDKAYLVDTQSARDANVKIQESDKASWLSKNVAYMIDIFIMLLWGTLTSYLLIVMLKIVQKEQGVDYTAVTAIWGAVTAVATTVINFHRGSSKSSSEKQDIINKVINGQLK